MTVEVMEDTKLSSNDKKIERFVLFKKFGSNYSWFYDSCLS